MSVFTVVPMIKLNWFVQTGASLREELRIACGRVHARRDIVTAIGLALPLVLVLTLLPGTLSWQGRVALAVFALAVIGWTLTRLGDTLIALTAAAALVVSGIVTSKQFYATLGTDLVWLLISAFVIAAVLKANGLAQKLVLAAVGGVRSVPALMHGITAVIVATALVIPSTSGRAALMLPAFLALSAVVHSATISRCLALVFPTAILLSAGGSLIGAGAHLVASDFAAKTGHRTFDYLDWLMLGMPLAVVSSHVATEMIIRSMLSRAERRSPLDLGARPPLALGTQEVLQIAIVAATVCMWMSSRLHGVEIAMIAVVGAISITLPVVSNVSLKTAAKSVEWDLILFMAATLLMGQALLATDVDEWLASGLLGMFGTTLATSAIFVAMVVAIVSLLAHLVITSRTARVTVLLPAFVLPIAAIGYDPVPLILLTVLGTGFCQTMTVSAKPVAIFANVEAPTYSSRDLLRFSIRFMPVMFVLMMANWLWLWPALGIHGTARRPAIVAAVCTAESGNGEFAKCRAATAPDTRGTPVIPLVRGASDFSHDIPMGGHLKRSHLPGN